MERDLAGRVVAITGANIGIGREVARGLAARGASLRLLCRSPEKVAPLVDELRAATDVAAIACDLGRFASVRTAAAELLARDEPLHVLVNNAGVGGQRGLTPEGFELHFGTNHLGHFLLTTLLLERLRASAPARIVHVASGSHYKAKRGIDWASVRQTTQSVSGLPEYAASKLANVLFSAELARRLEGTGVTSYAVNPGRVATNIWQRMPWPLRPLFKLTMLTSEQGAYSTLRAATDLAGSGGYFDKRAIRQPPSVPARDDKLAGELWERSAAWLAAG
ncbi:MAG: SDR family NAD(P)-dependent oxidoreductase [Deltaproteobacteria bacterium]|nr:SDR family NAD(P)-dependent oxidoreductase [Deltaproteobacteria bacterium]